MSVDGGWTDYGDWEPCTKSCGTGEKVRTRTCTKPTPANGGKNCEGKSQEKTTCNTAPCPGYTPLLNIKPFNDIKIYYLSFNYLHIY